MNRITRKDLEAQGIICVGCCALFFRTLWQMSEHVGGTQSGSSALHELFALFVLPISAYFSALTVVHLASRFAPTVGWWLRGSLRWAFWWVVRVAVAASVGGIVVSVAPGISGALLMKSTIAIPSIYLIRQALLDYRAARRRFGSLAQAERAMHPKGQRPSFEIV